MLYLSRMKIEAVSVFLPAYNEEKNIGQTVKKTIDVLKKIAQKWEVLVINDGSKDQTAAIVEKISQKEPRVRLINHLQNRGYGGALKTGFSKSRYPWVAFTDADGQFDFAEIEKFLPLTSKSDLILGYRLKRADATSRKLYTFGWRAVARFLLGLKVRDYSCGFKLIKRSVFEAVSPLKTEEKVTQIEFLVKAARQGFVFSEVGVHHFPRRFGAQTGANWRVVAKSIFDLFDLWRKLR